MSKVRFCLMCVVGVSLIIAAGSQAYAVSLLYDTSSDVLGTKYNFTLVNNGVDPINELFIHAPIDVSHLMPAGAPTFGSPSGWGDGFGGSYPNYGADSPAGTLFVGWYADTGAELPIGSSLPGFSFISDTAISDTISFSINSDNEKFVDATPQSTPNTVVPEPATMLLLGLGGVMMVACKRKQKVL